MLVVLVEIFSAIKTVVAFDAHSYTAKITKYTQKMTSAQKTPHTHELLCLHNVVVQLYHRTHDDALSCFGFFFQKR